MSAFPGIDGRQYVRRKSLLGPQSLSLWQTLPVPVVGVVRSPATLRVHLWSGRSLLLDDVDRSTSAGDVLAKVAALESTLSSVEAPQMQLVIGEEGIAPWRGVLARFDTLADDEDCGDAELSCSIVTTPCARVAEGVRELPAWAPTAALRDSGRDQSEPAQHFQPDSADAHPTGSLARFEGFMRRRARHEGNAFHLRPVRSAEWKQTFPGSVPVSNRWHELERIDFDQHERDRKPKKKKHDALVPNKSTTNNKEETSLDKYLNSAAHRSQVRGGATTLTED